MAFRIDPLIRKNARIFLEAAKSQSVIPVTESPMMTETLEKTWADLAARTEGTPLHAYFTSPSRKPLDLYRKWLAVVGPDTEPISVRFAKFATEAADAPPGAPAPDGTGAAEMTALVHDLVAPLQAVDATNDPDERCILILGLSLMILEQRWDQLNDAFVINVAHEIHSTYDRVLGKMSAKKKETYDPIPIARKFVCDFAAALFSVAALREAFMSVTADSALFLIEEKRIYPKLEFVGPTSAGKLDARCYEEEFVASHIEKLRALETDFGRKLADLQPLFPEADWDGEQKPRQFALLLLSLWDNDGLLSHMSASELVQMTSKHGPAWERAMTPLRMALAWVEAIRKIHRLAELLPTVEKLKPLDTPILWDDVPYDANGNGNGTPGRLDRYMAKIRDRETELNAIVFGIREKLVSLGIDFNGVLDPVLVEVLECLPERLVFPLETAQDFLHLAHRMGPLYEPLLFHIEEARREHSHKKKAFAFHQEHIEEVLHLIETKQFETVREAYKDATANYKERFEELDYGKIEACIAEWDQLLETHKTYRNMFLDFDKEVREERPVGDRRLVLQEHLEKWEAYIDGQKKLVATESDNDYRRDIEHFIDEIAPKLAELHKLLLTPGT